ncbi:DUF3857 domain-containing protein [uncultured Polaribacter sp.]|uniref:DUF3857 domain-containing protein n=1 Tax=uncultured Polaribacter sp. TaxID=174711 RepID=UPI00261C485B|nr:DUF3857 domain-containing protein [uncultured Polaribacter sp.]
MKKNKSFYFSLFLLLSTNIFSQISDYSSILIPSEIKEDANSVVRYHKTTIDVLGIDQMIISVNRTITVLNKLGDKNVRAAVGYDNNSKINKLEAKIYDAFGKEIKKVKKKNFTDVSAVDGGTLYSDSRVKYLDYTPISYPYTVHLEYEKKTSSTGFLPNWSPVENYFVSVQKNEFQVNLKYGKVRIKEKNFEGFEIEKSIDDAKIFYSIINVKSFKKEAYAISLRNYSPKSLIALNDFKTDGVSGSYTNWSEFGSWMNNSLLKNRNLLDEVTKIKVLKLVEGVDDPIEKAKIVYQFVQDNTRYISVQVGIGGIQPIAANEVDKLGYGDCKGLTNYTKSLLDLVGVTSYYTHVEANSHEPVSFEKDFASLEQGNHVILNIPNKDKDVWLECTSQTTPFGFLGRFTDDRDVLVITPEGGVIKHTTSYKNEENLQKLTAKIKLDDTGDLKATLQRISEGTQYDSKSYFSEMNQEELIKNYKTNVWDYNNNLEIISAKIENNKKDIKLKEAVEVAIKNYATVNEKEILFRVNVFNKESFIPKRYRTRNLPLKIYRGYKDVDEYIIHIPENYKLEYIPEKVELNTKFGTYSLSFEKVDEHQLLYKKSILIKGGTYSKEDYKLFRKFRRSIVKLENTRIALLKK